MKKIIHKTIWTLSLSSLLLTSCKEDDFSETVEPRLFSPVNLEQIVDLSEVNFSWQQVKDAVGYTLEVAPDSTFTQIIASFQTVETALSVSDLDFEQSFVARIKANALKSAMDSKYTIGAPFTTPNAPVVMKNPEEIGRDYVVAVWNKEMAITHIRISELSVSDTYREIELTDDDKTVPCKRIEGLNPATTYQLTALNNGQRFNKVNFRTKDALPAGTIEVPVGADLACYLDMANARDGASVLSLASGAEYELIESYQIRKDVTVMCDGSVKPLIRISQLNIAGSVGTIRFENLNITGQLSDGTYGDYFIKMIANNGSNDSIAFDYMEELILRNVEIHDFRRSVVRVEAKNSGYGKLTVENAVIYNFGEAGQKYALFHVGDDSKVNVYDIKQSTFYNFMFGLIQQQKSSQKNFSELVNIENCTFHNFGSNSYFANFKGHDGGVFNLKNCLFGKVMAPTVFKGIYGVKSSTSVGLTLNVSSSFSTADYATVSNVIKGLTAVPQSSEEFFMAPDAGNFKVTDNSYAASGDSRWN